MLGIFGVNVDMKSSDPVLTIGDVARRFGLPAHVLRHWEAMGLLVPERVNGRRRYRDDDLYRVAAILLGKRAGLSLDQIEQMMTTTDPVRRTDILRERRAEIERRVTAAQEAMALIDTVLSCRHADFTGCPRYRGRVTGRLTADTPPPG